MKRTSNCLNESDADDKFFDHDNQPCPTMPKLVQSRTKKNLKKSVERLLFFNFLATPTLESRYFVTSMIKYTKFFRCSNWIYRRNFYQSDFAVTTDLAPMNQYESQIFSTLKRFNGERIVQYKLGAVVPSKISVVRDSFFDAQTSNIFSRPKKGMKTYTSETTFECDLYMRIKEPEVLTVVELLQGAVMKIHKLNSVKDIKSAHNWLFIEVSMGPQFLADKLWQLERAARVFKRNDPSFNIGSCVVLHNGSENESDKAIREIKLPDFMLISKVPVYVGWVPTRNIYSVLQGMQDNIKGLQSDVRDIKVNLERLATLLVK